MAAKKKKKANPVEKAPQLAPNHVPAMHERRWYRSNKTGNRGYYVRVDGVDRIRLDRPNEIIDMPFNPGEWGNDTDHRPLSRMAVTTVAFEADRALCKLLGMHKQANRAWADCGEDLRIKWMETGPAEHPARAKLYKAVTDAMSHLAE